MWDKPSSLLLNILQYVMCGHIFEIFMKCSSLASSSLSVKLQGTIWDNTTLLIPRHIISLLHWSIAIIKVCDVEPTEYQRKVFVFFFKKGRKSFHFSLFCPSSLYFFFYCYPPFLSTLSSSSSFLLLFYCLPSAVLSWAFSLFSASFFSMVIIKQSAVWHFIVCVRTRTQAHACQSQQKHCSVLHFITTNHTTSCTQRISMCAIRRGCVSECVLCTHLLPLW